MEDDKAPPTDSDLVEQDISASALEFGRVIKKWPKKTIDWSKLFPKEFKTDTP